MGVAVGAPKQLGGLVGAFKWCKRAEGCMARTLADYDRVLGDFIATVGDVELADLSQAMVRGYVHGLMERGWKPATVNVYMRVLRCWLRWLYAEGYIGENLAEHVRPLKVPRQYPYVLTELQAAALIRAAKAQSGFIGVRDLALISLMLDTGLRLAEVVRLELGDVDLTTRAVRVRSGKGGKDRVVFLGKRATRAIRAWLGARGHIAGEEALWLSRTGEALTRRGVQEAIKRAGRAAKIEGVRLSAHTLRHTAASLYVRNGGDIASLQRLLGHSTITVTETYLHAVGNVLREAHAKASPVDRLLG